MCVDEHREKQTDTEAGRETDEIKDRQMDRNRRKRRETDGERQS